MINKYFILGILVLIVFMIGCSPAIPHDSMETEDGLVVYEMDDNFMELCLEKNLTDGNCDIIVHAICVDKLICYTISDEMICRRDRDLVERYCNNTRIKR